MHARFAPKAHRFAYRLFLFAVDLDELDTLHHRLRLFSANRRNLYSFREQDYLPTHEPVHNSGPAQPQPTIPGDQSLKSRVVAHLAQHGIDITGGRVFLVSLPRVFGYLFNPVSFYFCYDRTGAPVAAPLSWDEVHTLKSGAPFSVDDLETLRKRAVSRALKHWGKADQALPDV